MPPGAANNMPPPAVSESQKYADKIVSGNPRAGDYFPSLRRFQGGTVARWQHFPILIHLPPNTPESWQRSLTEGIKKWAQHLPIKAAADYEPYVIDLKWENHLPPNVYGITRIEGNGAALKVSIFLLRPTFYPQEMPETILQAVFLHEMGHALGLLGHSPNKEDIMYLDDKGAKRGAPVASSISSRDLNTIKKVYFTPCIPDAMMIQPPLEYSYAKPSKSN